MQASAVPATTPAPRSTDAAAPASDVVCLELEGSAYIAAVTRATLEKSERETRRDIPAVRPGRYCIMPPKMEAA